MGFELLIHAVPCRSTEPAYWSPPFILAALGLWGPKGRVSYRDQLAENESPESDPKEPLSQIPLEVPLTRFLFFVFPPFVLHVFPFLFERPPNHTELGTSLVVFQQSGCLYEAGPISDPAID